MKLTWANLVGTLQRVFRIRNVALTDDGGVVAARDKDDGADAPISASEARLKGTTAGQVVLRPSEDGDDYPLTLPDAQGADKEFLSNDGDGQLAWRQETDVLARLVTAAGFDESDVNVVVDSESGDVVWI